MNYFYDQYPDDILSGKIPSCETIRLACQRYKDFKQRDDMYFDKEDVERKIRVIYKMKHFTGGHAGKPFELLPWQQWCVASIFGFRWKHNNLRVCRKVFLMMARKSGKSSFASALGILGAIADNEPGAEIEIVANSRQQAKIDFDMTSEYCASLDPGKRLFKRYRDSVIVPATKSKIQVLSSDSMGLDGYNASVFILDEFHAARNYDLYNVLVSSQGSRQQPLGIIITTAGFLLDGYPCYETRKTCIDILKGTLEDPTQFSAIYELDKDDDWKNPDVWIKATPSLGQTVSYEYLKEQVTNAKNNPALEVGIRTKNFNSFLQSRNIWIPENLVTDCFDKIDMSDFTDQEAWMGVDLSAVSDLTAFSVMFTPDPDRKVHPDKFVFKSWIYVPEQTISDSLNCELYKFWKRQGYIIQTSGNVVDYDYILRDQLQVYGTCYLNGIGYDSWNATQWAIDATNEGLPLYPFSQTVGNFNKPTKLFEILLRQGKVIIDTNPCTRWSFNNVELKHDMHDNVKPIKASGDYNRKIDPIIAMIQALGTWLDKQGGSDGEVLTA